MYVDETVYTEEDTGIFLNYYIDETDEGFYWIDENADTYSILYKTKSIAMQHLINRTITWGDH